MESLLEKVLTEWKGHRIAITVGSEHSFTGILEDFDGEVMLLRDVVDVVGNRGKAMLVSLDDVSWVMLLE
ncbi:MULTISPECIES: LSm family protein [Thermococcaceae]|uniref:Sm domain-containing protein n=2 Tax=Thermococcaceae TaxID=2259 RepID=A0A161K966_9EURY|nr:MULTISPECIES: LSm family protein [Thermococcaceae]AMM54132.1 hypothetical protein TQ32_06305 [Pyrococcus kukulkanii]ASJ15789.1 hypothetical protein A3L04_01225 [Thermococcus chitonophagus]RLF88146.1 MAG: hypothetical protein DRN82_06890 [Thermococci archaeon]CUX77018.1 hypothetical protein CHITON_0239 [Thermococcus chitonophagus]